MTRVDHPRARAAVSSEDVVEVGAEVSSNASARVARSNFVVLALSGGRSRADSEFLVRVDHPRARFAVAK